MACKTILLMPIEVYPSSGIPICFQQDTGVEAGGLKIPSIREPQLVTVCWCLPTFFRGGGDHKGVDPLNLVIPEDYVLFSCSKPKNFIDSGKCPPKNLCHILSHYKSIQPNATMWPAH